MDACRNPDFEMVRFRFAISWIIALERKLTNGPVHNFIKGDENISFNVSSGS